VPHQWHASKSSYDNQIGLHGSLLNYEVTMHMGMRRFTRLTNGLSKKEENLKAAALLQFAHYNFVRIHRTLKCTPAMEAGVVTELWMVCNLVEMAS
jgi:hypothetical protein